MHSTTSRNNFSREFVKIAMWRTTAKCSILGCPVGFVRIKGDRISGLFHLLITWGIPWGEITH